MSVVGNVAIGEAFKSNSSTLYLQKPKLAWARLCETIHQQGSMASIQLACKLPSAEPPKKWKSRNVAQYLARSRSNVWKLTGTDVHQICQQFVSAALSAREVGFKAVQIHAAHGYFLSQLLTPATNVREDEFGGDGTKAIAMIIDGIKASAPEMIVDLRVSIRDGIEDREKELKARAEQLATLSRCGLDMISLSAGHYEVDRFLIYPKASWGYAVYLPDALQLARRHPAIHWNVAGNFWRPLQSTVVPQNLTISVGRSLLADPQFLEKILAGDRENVNECVRAGQCHYFTRGEAYISCKVNRKLGELGPGIE